MSPATQRRPMKRRRQVSPAMAASSPRDGVRPPTRRDRIHSDEKLSSTSRESKPLIKKQDSVSGVDKLCVDKENKVPMSSVSVSTESFDSESNRSPKRPRIQYRLTPDEQYKDIMRHFFQPPSDQEGSVVGDSGGLLGNPAVR